MRLDKEMPAVPGRAPQAETLSDNNNNSPLPAEDKPEILGPLVLLPLPERPLWVSNMLERWASVYLAGFDAHVTKDGVVVGKDSDYPVVIMPSSKSPGIRFEGQGDVLPEEREAIQIAPIITELRASGITTLKKTGEALFERGITAPRGGPWSEGQVKDLLMRIERLAG